LKYPCRPIVDFNPSPLCKLSKFLNGKLQPFSGKLPSHLKNSIELKEKLENIKIKEDEILLSLDVTALYSSIPLDLALQVCFSHVSTDHEFEVKLGIDIEDFMRLLEFCLRNTYFVYRKEFYRQIKGLPMGASISVTVANLVMEHIEIQAFNSSPHLTPRFLSRYIDDLLGISRKDALLSLLNGINKDIQFTHELEVNSQLPYLDSLISYDSEGRFSFSVYRKPTHSGRYLNFASSNPISHKRM
jgi:hypothetical protein